MKYRIMLGILFTLLGQGRVRAADLAAKFDCSLRSIYRYLEELSIAGIPVDVAHGPHGGVYISDCYKLPRGFLTREEYAKTLDAMHALCDQLGDPALFSAIEKMTAQMKSEKFDPMLSGNLLVDSGAWGDERRFSDKIALFERAIENHTMLEIDYIDRGGEETRRKIMPHLLVYKQNVWYVYAFCLLRHGFRLFKLGRVRTAAETKETFEPVSFSREDVPLSFHRANSIDVRFAISPEAFPLAEEWLGVENVRKAPDGQGYLAEVSLPDDESLVGKILSAGAGFRVVYPPELKERVKREALTLVECYR